MLQEHTELQNENDELQHKFYQRLDEFYDEYFLNKLQKVAMTTFIKAHLGKKQNDQVSRIRPWILSKINKKSIISEQQMQKGCPDIIPGLRAKCWWDATQFPWLQVFEQKYLQIRQQLLTLRSKKGFQPYRGPSWISQKKAQDGIGNESVDMGNWNVYYLQLHNLKFNTNCQQVPLTMQLIKQHIPNNYHHTFFSALTPNSHILKHHGPTNKKLRFHLPLLGVKGSKMRVGKEIKEQQQGKAYVFDDSFEHEAWHQGNETRLILIVDFWHPDLTPTELKMLKVLQNSRFKAQAVYSQMDPDKDNFYSIIENAKDIIKDNQWWVINKCSNYPLSTAQQSNDHNLQP